MTDQNISSQEVKQQLEDLKKVLPKELDRDFSKLFDQFIRENEFGLALHVICDHLLDSIAQPATTPVLEKIQSLHAAMKIEDNCVRDLKTKTALSNQ